MHNLALGRATLWVRNSTKSGSEWRHGNTQLLKYVHLVSSDGGKQMTEGRKRGPLPPQGPRNPEGTVGPARQLSPPTPSNQ